MFITMPLVCGAIAWWLIVLAYNCLMGDDDVGYY